MSGMTQKDIAIGLYRENLTRAQIRRKMGIKGVELAEYLADEPKRPRKRRVCTKPVHRRKSPARVRGEALLLENLKVKVVHSTLQSEGYEIAISTICRWHMEIFGRVNKRVPKEDYPVLERLIKSNPGVTGAALSKLYHETTGKRVDHRAAGHWCRKVRASA